LYIFTDLHKFEDGLSAFLYSVINAALIDYLIADIWCVYVI